MLHKSIKFFIENKILAVLLFCLFTVWGISHSPFSIDVPFIPSNPVAVDAIPNIGENQQIVYTEWKGKSPQDIEDQITYPLTTLLVGVPGVKTIRSSSMFGFSSIYIIFEENVDFYWSRSRIIEKLNALPSGVLPDGVSPSLGPDATGLGQIFWYTIEGRDENGNVTGGWDLQELRSIQDYYIKYGLSAASGVSEVASIGGYIKEYQIDVKPELAKQYGISLSQIIKAVRENNKETGAKTLEINNAEYVVRGLGYIKSISDIENTVITSNKFTSLRIKDIAKVSLGPKERRGILDKEGAEVVGGVVIARYGANPMEVITNVKDKIKSISSGLPSKKLKDGRISQLQIVPFYDRTELIKETISTLNEALVLEVLITILVIIIMLFNIRASILISGLLPVAVLMVFIAMKLCAIEANIVALSGIAIAIGTMVDIGVILSENIIRHLENNTEKQTIDTIVYNATTEVSGAIVTAVLTTIISFIPVFTMIGAEGKLFRPLAFTKTMALIAALLVALFLIPPFAAILFRKLKLNIAIRYSSYILYILIGIFAVTQGILLGIVVICFGILQFIAVKKIFQPKINKLLNHLLFAITTIILLAIYWKPLGVDKHIIWNLIFVGGICFGLLGIFIVFKSYYIRMLDWVLTHKGVFILVPISILFFGYWSMSQLGSEFMPALNEGSFLLMPSSLPHAGITENKRVLQQLDMAVATIPEIETVVGKAGRIASALDPAPLSMYENIIKYKPEYTKDINGQRKRFKVNEDGLFVLKNGTIVTNNDAHRLGISSEKLIEDKTGAYFRNWRPHIKSSDDIWDEITQVTQIPGITAAPKLQPIETRLLMLQTGMRSPMGIKVKGQDIDQIESFCKTLEGYLKDVEGVNEASIYAEKTVGKPYMMIDIDRERVARYGISILKVQETIETAIGGIIASHTIEGRERYGIRVRYPRTFRDNPDAIKKIYVTLNNGTSIPLGELATIRYEQGPQVIKSEDTFLVGYVLFDKEKGYAAGDVIQNVQTVFAEKIHQKQLNIPNGITYEFTGTYEHQVRAEKTLLFVVPLSLIIIFLILYFQFKSITTSIIIFTSIAVAFAGGFIWIWLYNQHWFLELHIFGINIKELFGIQTVYLSVAVWVGFIALFGIATDDGVVMTTYLNQIFENSNPKSKKEVRNLVIKAGEKRIRPCLMTTATTILALLPILTSTGRGSDIMIPMAIPIFGGMLMALITLFVIPLLYSWKEELKVLKVKH